MQLPDQATGEQHLLENLEGQACAFCEEGQLVRGSYKGNTAALCDECGTPGAQLW
ncbi:HVO_A0556 family zinc finger protein [Natrinema sp. CGMCC1.2065]|uniref:HVO_A0556 family zinc finger protein n=1 Tax=Natrinema sp. CGMCC1.2065 TaxID=3445767 RepID=UPI003F4A4CD3